MHRVTFTALLLITVSLTGFSQKPYSITGTINAPDGVMLYLRYNNGTGTIVVDSAVVSDSRFRLSGAIPATVMTTLQCKGCGADKYASLFIEPADMQLSIDTAAFRRPRLSGSRAQSDFEAYEAPRLGIYERMAPIQKRFDAMNGIYIDAKKKGAGSDVLDSIARLQKAIDAEFDTARRIFAVEDVLFRRKFPTSVVNAFFLDIHKGGIQLDTLQAYYDRLGAETQQTTYGRSIRNFVDTRRKLLPGAMAADFRTVDINGKPLKLSGFRGKYVLLDFWASWCVPCRELSPHLKDLYTRYKEKGLEIIGIASDDGEVQRWKDAVKKDALPWPQVLSGATEDPKKSAASSINGLFSVGSLPTHILIDPNGKIIARYGGGGEPHANLDARLATELR